MLAYEKIFQNYKYCEFISSKEYLEEGELIDFFWDSKKIESDPIIDPIYYKYYKIYKEYAEEIIVSFEVGYNKSW